MTHKSPSAANVAMTLSNLQQQCDELRAASKLSPATCLYQADHRLQVVDAYLAAYTAAGEDVKFLPLAEKLCSSMLMMVSTMCRGTYWNNRAMSEVTHERMETIINKVIELTEMVDEPDYGLDAADRFNAVQAPWWREYLQD